MTVSYVQITHLVPKEFESQISRNEIFEACPKTEF